MGEPIRRVRVELKERSYTILIGDNILGQCIKNLRDFPVEEEVFVVTDSNVDKIYGEKIMGHLRGAGFCPYKFVVPAGEEAKSWDQAEQILRVMLERNLSRRTCLLALGGGVVGDLAGFTAALYRRGVPLFQVPTTLLAQVDSSIGGKVAVNHPLGKNMVGTFYQPRQVWADLFTLRTLPRAEWQAGLAEVAKYGVIGSRDFFEFLEDNAGKILERNQAVLQDMVEKCCRTKAAVVMRDERDEGLRNILNFGHTIGHALESATHYKKYRHGEAVSIGMVGACLLSAHIGLAGEELAERLKALLVKWGLPVSYPECLFEAAAGHLRYDKKAVAQKLTFVLPRRLGEVETVQGLAEETVREVMKKLAHS